MIRSARFWLGLGLAAAAGLTAMAFGAKSGMATPPDNAYYDAWHRLAGIRHRPANVVMVVVDEPSLAQNTDPLVFWTPQVAAVSAALRAAGAKVVGLDLMFSISPESWLRDRCPGPSEYDLPLRTELAGGKLVMVGSRVTTREGHDGFLLPSPDYLLALPNLDLGGLIGLSDLSADNDGSVRRFVSRPALKLPPEAAGTSLPAMSFAPLLAAHATGTVTAPPRGDAAEPRRIAYSGPPGTFSRISFADVLTGTDKERWPDLAGKVAIVGAEFLSANDFHHTPYSSGFFGTRGNLMSGPEIQASITEAILADRHIAEFGDVAQAALGGALYALAAAAFLVLGQRAGLALLAALLVVPAAASYALFLRDAWLPVVQYQMGLVACFLAALGVRLATGEREQAHMRRLFSRYVSDQVVDLLLASGRHVDLGGTKQTITVLFSDIRDFTTLAERLDAHEVVEMLNQYFERACDAVLAEGGTIDKFVGDAIMVEFGAPLPYPDHALRAVRAALAMARVAADFQAWMTERFASRELPAFRIGIGLHTGVAVVGNIGSSKRTEYTAIGDTVNVAARIEGETKTMGCTILASRETVNAATGVLTGRTATVQVKGRGLAVELFEVVGVR